ncbi:HEPN domain-containing protein [Echinimonas agarilytica]|uniref:HEPN domain-containing protein n=1 Tax=Echinimonas agarilytica TaxID=1215918 RepID=A0AA41W3E8_9GAMM|nr:HEPN domain-containing protein [Echinimonas agarilytica]MCM2678096.1 HEPN domain-containing protein [Echinimonas agarilytica]
MQFIELKHKQRKLRSGFNENLSLRVHRALSWFDKAEQSSDDSDAQFIFLWIAFNAAYANDIAPHHKSSELNTTSQFIARLCELDSAGRLNQLVWSQFTGPIRVLLDNPYVFQPFWDHQNGQPASRHWEEVFCAAKAAANAAMGRQDTAQIIGIVLARLYTLRNQLMHGGATWNSSVNRHQIRDCVCILNELVPLVIDIMMDHGDQIWGDPYYPVIKD